MKSGKARKSGKAKAVVSNLAVTAKHGKGVKGGTKNSGRVDHGDLQVSKVVDKASAKIL